MNTLLLSLLFAGFTSTEAADPTVPGANNSLSRFDGFKYFSDCGKPFISATIPFHLQIVYSLTPFDAPAQPDNVLTHIL
jgi:hypothetical protein